MEEYLIFHSMLDIFILSALRNDIFGLYSEPATWIAILRGGQWQWRASLIRRMIVTLNVCLFEPIQAI